MATTLVAAGSVYVGSVNHNIKRDDLLTSSAPAGRKPPAKAEKGSINIVIVGETGRKSHLKVVTNRVMVLHIAKDRKSAAVLSFPMNTYVRIPGRRWGTLSSVYAMGGAKLLDQTLESMFNTRMDHMAVADLDGFLALSMQVGPVTVDNPKSFTSLGITFEQGPVSLEGERALAFVRAAAGDAPGDQVTRQQLVIEAGVRKELEGDLLSSPTKLAKFIRAASKNLVVDKGLSAMNLAKIAFSLDLTADDVTVIRVPLSSEVLIVKGQAVRKVDPVLFKELAYDLNTDNLAAYIAAHPNPS